MAAYLTTLADAFARFMPEITNFASRTMTYRSTAEFRAGIVEGDVVINTQGAIETSAMVEAFKDARLGALFITGSLIAPEVTLVEPDIDWSPMLKVKGDVFAKNLCLGGSASEIDGNVTVSGALTGYYNHGQMRIRGRTRADVIIASDYEFIFDGPVERRYVLSSAGRLNLPVDYDEDRLELILTPEVISESNFINDGRVIDRLKRGLPILRPAAEIGTPPPPMISEAGAERLQSLAARLESGGTIDTVDFMSCELRFVPDELLRFNSARNLVLAKNKVRALPIWLGDFTAVEVLNLAGCGLDTIPVEVARLPKLRDLDLSDNGITALPSKADCFQSVEILRIGEGFHTTSAEFVANLDLSLFPKLRVLEQDYSNTIETVLYSDEDRLWDNPNLEVLNAASPAFEPGIPAGLLEARNLHALATRLNGRNLPQALERLPRLQRLKYLSAGYGKLSRADLCQLSEGLPGCFIACHYVDGQFGDQVPEHQQLWSIENKISHRQYPAAVTALETLLIGRDLRQPLLPVDTHARLLKLSSRVYELAALFETDAGQRRAWADHALASADRALEILPRHVEACWHLDHHKLWLARLQSLYAKGLGLALGSEPAPQAALDIFDAAQAEVDRFLLPINPAWHGSERAELVKLREQIPD
jgi:Leucine-rich repeat (LRR) protein